jgi:hypothetical protein
MRTISILALAYMAVASAFAAPAHPRWALHWYSGKGDFYIDQPSCGSLEYFSSNPKKFDHGYDLFGKQPADTKDRVTSQRIGEIQQFTIYQVIHDINAGEVVMKMILVERKTGEVCAIFQQQYGAAMLDEEPAHLVNVGSDTILATDDRVSGNGAFRLEEYWTFDRDGPIPLHVRTKITEISQKILPQGRTVLNASGFDIQTLSFAMPVWRDGDAHCCPSGGNIRIKFALKEHHLTVASQNFDRN